MSGERRGIDNPAKVVRRYETHERAQGGM